MYNSHYLASYVTVHTFPRYITRAVIVPFGDTNDMSAANRVEADSALKELGHG